MIPINCIWGMDAGIIGNISEKFPLIKACLKLRTLKKNWVVASWKTELLEKKHSCIEFQKGKRHYYTKPTRGNFQNNMFLKKNNSVIRLIKQLLCWCG